MAKKFEQKAKTDTDGHNRVQGFVFGINLEGSRDVVMEGIKAFTQAMAKTGATLAPPATRAALIEGGKQAATTAAADEEPDTGVEEVSEMEPSVATSEEASRSDNGTERRRRIPPDPKIIHDLDINAGSVPLRTFVEQKSPRKAQDRIVVVAVWLKRHQNYDEISRDHLYTCYQQMGGTGDWKSPNDFDNFLRTLGKRKGWFDKGTGEASFRVTIVASNYVDGMTATSA